jgi:hypothetical protein
MPVDSRVPSSGALHVLEYQKSFGICHPFFIPFDDKLAGITRKDFEEGVQEYMAFCTQRVPQVCVDHLACLTCNTSEKPLFECQRCRGWVMCGDCFSAQEGHCAQCCSTTKQMQAWIVRTGAHVT